MRVAPAARPASVLWLIGALGFAALFIGRSMAPALRGPGVIQDDARQHVFWMLRWADPTLFRDDLIADYFQAQAPPLSTALYWVLTRGVDPLTASKLVPPLVGLAAALFTFLLARRLGGAPAAFLATVIASWYVWQYDDLATGSPRAFLLPFLAAQLWLLAGGRRWSAVGVAVSGALFYPTAGALMAAVLGARLLRLDGWRPALSGDRRDWLAVILAGALVIVTQLPILLGGRFGPTVSVEAAHAMPEFGPGGRNAFFFPDPYQYWVESYRGGLDLRVRDVVFPSMPILFELAGLALLLPLSVLLTRRGRPAVAASRETILLIQVLLASFSLFFLAHALLFRLYLPARFVQWSLPLVLAVAAGIGIARLTELWLPQREDEKSTHAKSAINTHVSPTPKVFRTSNVILSAAKDLRTRPLRRSFAALRMTWGRRTTSLGLHRGELRTRRAVNERLRGAVAGGLPLALALGLALYPAQYDGNFVQDRYPRISTYLRAQPADTLVAAVPIEADSVPSFTGRPVVTAREYALAYHPGYYEQLAERTRDLIDAYYAASPREVADFSARYGVTIFLVNRAAFGRETFVDAWAGEFEPYISQIATRLRRSDRYALLDAARRGGVLTEGDVTVVPESCFR